MQHGKPAGPSRSPHEGTFTFADGTTDVWKLKASTRARNISVRMSPQEGISVVVPSRARCEPLQVMEQHRDWIERTHTRMLPQRTAFLHQMQEPLPEEIVFPTADERWQVVYRASCDEGIRFRRHPIPGRTGGILTLSGKTEDRTLCCAALKRFTLAQARLVLPELLAKVAEEQGVGYAGCRVGTARTRWGSCSADGTIMLSSKLLLLPPEMSRHVICHELAHRHHMDHSRRFHDLLEQMDPQARDNATALRKASIYLPAWAQ